MIDIQCKGFEMGFYYPHTLNINVYNGKGDSLCTYKSFCRLRSNYNNIDTKCGCFRSIPEVCVSFRNDPDYVL